MGQVLLGLGSVSKPNWRTRIPGRSNWSRSASTAGVIRPRSSAISGRSANRFWRAWKNAAPGPGTHSPVGRRLRLARDFPVGLEAPEVVDPDHVDLLQQGAQTVDPPGVAFGRVHVPAVERIAPELARGAEVVRRHPRHARRPAALVEEEQVRPRPDVGAVVRDEDRDVADQSDPLFGTCLAQFFPSARRRRTGRTGGTASCSAILSLPSRQRRGLAGHQLRLPLEPRLAPAGSFSAMKSA